MSERVEGSDQRIWIPDISREVVIDAYPEDDEYYRKVLSLTDAKVLPRLYLFTPNEALKSSLAAEAINQVIASQLPSSIDKELEVMTTGIVVENKRYSRNLLRYRVEDAQLSLERQPILEAVFDSLGKIPTYFKDFRWAVDFGRVLPGVDITALPNDLEDGRPEVILLRPASFRPPTSR